MKRVIAALILMPIAILVVWFGQDYSWLFLAFVVIVSTLAVLEAARIAKKAHIKTQPIVLALANIAIQICVFYPKWRIEAIIVPFVLLFWLFLYEIISGKPEGAISRIGASLLILIIGCLFSFLSFLENIRIGGLFGEPFGWRLVFSLLAGVWAFDIFSYYGGKMAGRKKLARVSPGKTWEGLIIGAFLGLAIFVVAGYYLILRYDTAVNAGFSWTHLIISGFVVMCASLLGDLGESVMKRDANVKDSSKLIMGHGGILDRMDSLMLASPAFFFYLVFVLKGLSIG